MPFRTTQKLRARAQSTTCSTRVIQAAVTLSVGVRYFSRCFLEREGTIRSLGIKVVCPSNRNPNRFDAGGLDSIEESFRYWRVPSAYIPH